MSALEFIVEFKRQTLEIKESINSYSKSDLLRKISQLSQSLANSKSFLNQYDMETCTKEINLLRKLSSKANNNVSLDLNSTRKKFSFSSTLPIHATQENSISSHKIIKTVDLATPDIVHDQIIDIDSELQPHPQLNNMENCIVRISQPQSLTSLYIKNCTNVIVLIISESHASSFSGTWYVEDCEKSVFLGTPYQYRIHKSCNCKFILSPKASPIIEDSTNLKFLSLDDHSKIRINDFAFPNSDASPNYTSLQISKETKNNLVGIINGIKSDRSFNIGRIDDLMLIDVVNV